MVWFQEYLRLKACRDKDMILQDYGCVHIVLFQNVGHQKKYIGMN